MKQGRGGGTSVAASWIVTPRQNEKYRQQLISQLTAIYRGVHEGMRDSMVRELFDDDQPRDEMDQSQDVQLRDLTVRLAAEDAERAQLMEEALRRIQKGEFGVCVDCGNAIAAERLNLVPWAPRCIDCQTSVESEARMHPPTM